MFQITDEEDEES